MAQRRPHGGREPRSAQLVSLPLDATKVPIGYVSLDREGHVIDVNPKWYEILGYSRSEVQGHWFGDFVAKRAQRTFRERFVELPNRGEIVNVELPMVHKDGHPVVVLFSGTVERDTSGEITRIHSFLHDVTAVLSDKELHEQGERRFRELFNHMSSCVAVYEARSGGEEFVIVDLNEAVEKTEQVTRGDVLGKSVLEVFPGAVEFGLFEVFQRVWRTGNPEHHPVSLYRDERIQGWKENYIYRLPSGEVVALYDDVTEQRRAEEATRVSEERLRLALEATTEGLYDIGFGARRKETYFGPQYLRMLGYNPDELTARAETLELLLHPDDRERALLTMASVEREGPDQGAMEFRLRTNAGGWCWIRSAWRVVGRAPDGRALRLVGTHVDITAQKEAERRLRSSSEYLAEIIDAIGDPVFVKDEVFRFTLVNNALCTMLGKSRDELLGTTGGEFLPPDQMDHFLDVDRMVLSSGEENLCEELLTDRNGEIRTIVTRKTRHVSHDGARYIVGVIRDVTERKLAELALQESEEKYRLVVETASEAIFIVQDESLQFANAATLKLFQRSAEEVAGRPLVEFIHPDDRAMVLERNLRLLAGETVEKGHQFRVVNPAGDVRWAELNAARAEWHGRPATVNLLSDITERVDALERLKRSQNSIIRSVGAITEMRDPYTAGHQERVAALATAIASEMRLNQDRIDGLRVAAELHDIGKMSIPAEILSKPAKLTEVEFSLVREHSQTGYEILKDIDFPWPIAEIVLQHHERVDGSGYPRGLAGNQICLEAKILAVADTVEAMASHRPYRPALGIDAALQEIREQEGKLYDAEVVAMCVQLFADGFEFAQVGAGSSP